MTEPVRIALVGAGAIVHAAHKPAWEELRGIVRPVAVSDPLGPSAGKLAAELGVPAFSTPGEMLDHLGSRVDAVLITSPHDLHAPQAEEALRRGLPALVEKPLACSMEEMRRLRAAEKTGGAFAQAGQQQRFGTGENLIKQWLHGPEFGAAGFDVAGGVDFEESYTFTAADR